MSCFLEWSHSEGENGLGRGMTSVEESHTVRMTMDEAVRGELRAHLEGTLDRDTVPDVRKRLLRVARREGLRRLSVDFSRVERLDTAGVAVMVEVLRAVSARGGSLSLEGLGDDARRLFRLARLDEAFHVNGEPKVGE